MGRKTKISIIYFSEDKDVLLHLLHHLKDLMEDYNLAVWQDDPILPGQMWKPQNASLIQQADVFLLLISDHFMHSEFIKQLEFKLVIDRYKEDKARVLPIIIDKCNWDIEFKSDDYDFKLSELQVLPEVGKPISEWEVPELGYNSVAASIKKVIASIGISPDQSFTVKDEDEKVATAEEEQLEISFNEEGPPGKTGEESKIRQAAEAQKIIEEEQRQITAAEKRDEENRINAAAAAAKRIEEEKRRDKETENSRNIKEEKRSENTNIGSVSSNEEQQGKYGSLKRVGVVVLGIILIILLGVWIFSGTNNLKEEQLPVPPSENINAVNDALSAPAKESETVKSETSLSKLEIGDLFEGGIVFTIDGAGKTGKIAQLEDAGPMTWNEAIKIHEQLGDQWRLPSFEELATMYRNIGRGASNQGEFANSLYWSATDYDEHQARLLRFSDGNTSYHYNKELAHRTYLVRAIRDFIR
ncbi:TIR domain-containing protein [Muriicola sp. Z0-33]|uniref:TIR domain-containing protein n=1 Tax=Muriicola sp. Z0-33 TaxID=2816957 RepID=UPI002238874A|nr:TIR domain-containing protein [Muriicola sp. Z0-33]MCW5515419.1 TIR domain-containing protein [Muriicola sp. Z0-33]